jgi:methylglutaconyl-CoA hydratase
MSETVLLDVDQRGVATLTLNRPDVRNAFDNDLIAKITGLLVEVQARTDVRVVVLTGAGTSFSSGADINWMKAMADFSEEQNYEDALQLAELMATLNHLTKPTIGRINGHAFGGGVGLVCCCDIAIAASEAVGPRNARRFFLSAEPMSARKARRVGLVHEVAKTGKLDVAVEDQVAMLLKGGPSALRESKELVHTVSGHSFTADLALKKRTAEIIAQMRVSDEGQEGLKAFLQKRSPRWCEKP